MSVIKRALKGVKAKTLVARWMDLLKLLNVQPVWVSAYTCILQGGRQSRVVFNCFTRASIVSPAVPITPV